jgi:hypothetical protein
VKESTHIIYKTKNDRMRTRCYPTCFPQEIINLDTSALTHEILKLTLRSGEAFAVDITGHNTVIMSQSQAGKNTNKIESSSNILRAAIQLHAVTGYYESMITVTIKWLPSARSCWDKGQTVQKYHISSP